MEHQPKFVPISIWIKAAIIACMLFFGSFFFILQRDKKINYSPLHDEFQTFTNTTNGNKPSVYILGTSLTNYAFCRYHTTDSILIKTNKKIDYRIITKSSATPEEALRFIPEIEQLKPKYLFIEANLFCVALKGKGLNAVSISLMDYSARLSRFPVFILRNPSYLFKLYSSPIPQDYVDKFVKTNKTNFNWFDYASRAKYYSIRSVNDFEEWNFLFKKAKALGIKIIFIDLPRSKEADSNLNEDFKTENKELIEEMRVKFDIDYWKFPCQLGFENYYDDAAHFNATGAELYSQWFVNTAIERLKLP